MGKRQKGLPIPKPLESLRQSLKDKKIFTPGIEKSVESLEQAMWDYKVPSPPVTKISFADTAYFRHGFTKEQIIQMMRGENIFLNDKPEPPKPIKQDELGNWGVKEYDKKNER